MPESDKIVRLEFCSSFDMLDFVQVVSDHIGHMTGLDEDSRHWVSVAVRESVINAIKHGNQLNSDKPVMVEFTYRADSSPELIIIVRDRGPGFKPEQIADPLSPENMLKSSGRGIFFMRSFMDDVAWRPAPGGGMEVVMVKKLGQNSR